MHEWAGAVVAALVCVGLLSGCASGSPGGVSPGTAVAPPSSSPSVSSISQPASSPPAGAAAKAAAPTPSTTEANPRPVNPCAHNRDAQKVIVSIRAQHAWMCARRAAVYATAVTTGMAAPATSTPTGDYRIEARNTNAVLTLNTGAQYRVRYWIPFEAPLFGFHDSSWQDFPYGSAKYRTQGSHGCIHMPLTAMAFLYGWSARPTSVHIS